MSIGVNWAEIWASVWKPVWQGAGAAAAVSTGQTPAGGSKRRRRDKYIARYKGQEHEFDTIEEVEALVKRAKEEQSNKPKAKRAPVRIQLSDGYIEEVRPFVLPPARMEYMPPSAALAQVRRIEALMRRRAVEQAAERAAYDEDEEEIVKTLLWLM